MAENPFDIVFAESEEKPKNKVAEKPKKEAIDNPFDKVFAKEEQPKSKWQKAKDIAYDVAAEPFRIGAETGAGLLNTGVKSAAGLISLPVGGYKAAKTYFDEGKTAGESVDAGLQAAGKLSGMTAEDRNRIKSPLDSSATSSFIGKNIVQPAVNKLSQVTGQPEMVQGAVEVAGDVASLFGIKPGIKTAASTGKNLLKSAVDSGLPLTNPEKLYGSAAKLPLSKTWTKQIGPEATTRRTEAIKAGIEGEVPINEVGIEQAKGLEKSFRATVDDVVKQLDTTGALIPKDRLKAGLTEAYKTAKVEGTDMAEKIVDRLYDERFEKMGTVDQNGVRQYKPSEIQEIKRHLYKSENWEKQKLSRGLGSQLKELGNKGMASEAKTALEELNPELKSLNRQDAAYINLVEALERAVPRIQNRDMVGLGAKVLLTGAHPWTALIEHTIGLPSVKAKLAFALNKARKRPREEVTANAFETAGLGEVKASTQPSTSWGQDNREPEPRQEGGSVDLGKTYLVGEKQPELLLNADGTKQIVGGSGEQVITPQQQGVIKPSVSVDYDMDGYIKKYGVPDQSKGQHLTDEFKLPNHITFSKESNYSKNGQEGGAWVKEKDGSWTFYASKYNLQNHSPEELQRYFALYERGNKLILPDNKEQ